MTFFNITPSNIILLILCMFYVVIHSPKTNYFLSFFIILLGVQLIGDRLSEASLAILSALGLGIAIGIILFVLSLVLTSNNFIFEFKSILKAKLNLLELSKHQIFTHILTAIYEELLWRVVMQGLLSYLIGPLIAIVIVAISFWLKHINSFYSNKKRAIEFILFSLILGILFEFTKSYVLVVIIHSIRNLLILGYRCEVIKNQKTTNAN